MPSRFTVNTSSERMRVRATARGRPRRPALHASKCTMYTSAM